MLKQTLKLFILVLSSGVLWGCPSINEDLNNLQDNVNERWANVEEFRIKYQKWREDYKTKREQAKMLIDQYYGETKSPSKDEEGVQDIIYKRVYLKTDDEEKKKFLKEANEKFADLVAYAKKMDARAQKLDKKIQQGHSDLKSLKEDFNSILEKGKDWNSTLKVAGQVFVQSLRLGQSYIDG